MRRLACATTLIVVACAPTGPSNENLANDAVLAPPANNADGAIPASVDNQASPANAVATAPPDDRTAISEAPFTETSAQGAANVVETYYALLKADRASEAFRLWSGGGEASGLSEPAFAERRRRYRDYHAKVFAPGAIEGAAGSLYVDVPVRSYGHDADGRAFSRRGTVTLRRVNDVPGSTAEQRRWHIVRSDIEPPPEEQSAR
jgi:hypothetical protein